MTAADRLRDFAKDGDKLLHSDLLAGAAAIDENAELKARIAALERAMRLVDSSLESIQSGHASARGVWQIAANARDLISCVLYGVQNADA